MATYKILDNQGNLVLDNQTQEQLDALIAVNEEGEPVGEYSYFWWDTDLLAHWAAETVDTSKQRIIQQIEE